MSNLTSFTLHLEPFRRFFANSRFDCDVADVQLLREVTALLGERAYACETGSVRVRLDWSPLIVWRRRNAERSEKIDLHDESTWDAASEEPPFVDAIVQFIDERGQGRDRDAHSYVELFLHDCFLMLNVAVPGSFGGRMEWSWGGLQERSVSLDPRVFETAWATAAKHDWPRIEPLPLSRVIAWYEALAIGTQQVAPAGTASALFHLLYLARLEEEEDATSMVRLALALEAVFDARASFLAPAIESLLAPTASLPERLQRFFEDRDAIVLGTAPVAHPMYDDSLDPRADDEAFDYTEPVDFASGLIVAALQQQVRAHAGSAE